MKVMIQDTGCGIDEHELKNISLPFYSSKRGGQGNMGLGLSVSYGIITKYNGTITVENIKNSGCRFTITIIQ